MDRSRPGIGKEQWLWLWNKLGTQAMRFQDLSTSHELAQPQQSPFTDLEEDDMHTCMRHNTATLRFPFIHPVSYRKPQYARQYACTSEDYFSNCRPSPQVSLKPLLPPPSLLPPKHVLYHVLDGLLSNLQKLEFPIVFVILACNVEPNLAIYNRSKEQQNSRLLMNVKEAIEVLQNFQIPLVMLLVHLLSVSGFDLDTVKMLMNIFVRACSR